MILRSTDWGLVGRYLVVRRQTHHRFEGAPLPTLLAGPTPEGRPIELSRALASIRVAESVVRQLTWWPDTCLFRAIARFRVLSEAGHEVTFCMGIRPDDPTDGHAWVALDESVLLEAPPRGFTTTFTTTTRRAPT